MKFLPAQRPDYARYEGLKLSFDGGVATVTLSNPGKKNACTMLMQDELTTIWDDLWVDPEVRIIVLTGDGGDFCAGADVSDLAQASSEGGTEVQYVNRNTRYARKHVMGILECEKPVIAKVRGVAYGMGVNMALACDMVFASDTARFCDSHVKIGLVAGDGGVLLWPFAIGAHRAKQYLMTGDPVPANVASEIGLINGCMPDEELDGFVDNMVQKLLALPPHAVNYTKASINQVLKNVAGSPFETSLAYEVYTMKMSDVAEATAAFVERRKGDYTGN